jgi:hypothetical protein
MKTLKDWQGDKNIRNSKLTKKQLREIKRINKIQKSNNFKSLENK